MGRPKGSKNKPKNPQEIHSTSTSSSSSESQQTKTTNQTTTETSDVAQQPDPAPATDAVETPAEVAPAAPAEGSEEAPNPDATDAGTDAGGLSEHQAAPPRATSSSTEETIEQINSRIRSLWRDRAMEKLAAAEDAKEHSDEIKRIEKEIDGLVQKAEELDLEEVIDRDRGVVSYKSRSTGEVKRTRPITFAERQEILPFDKPSTPPAPPRATFADLVDGKVWEHEEHGYCRILAVLEDSVRVQTEDLDEDDAGIEISREDWDSHEAHPREVPEIEIGQVWAIDGREAIITGLDDFAALVTWTESDEPARIARLTFCGASKPSSDDDAPAVPEIAEGQHWRLTAGDLVTVTAVEETHASVRWAKTGMNGSVPIDDFAGSQAVRQEEIDAALVHHEEPKRSRKRAAGAED